MRKIALFVVSAAVLSAGPDLLWLQFRCVLGFAEGTCHFGGGFAVAGASLVCLGGYLLWEDFISLLASKI